MSHAQPFECKRNEGVVAGTRRGVVFENRSFPTLPGEPREIVFLAKGSLGRIKENHGYEVFATTVTRRLGREGRKVETEKCPFLNPKEVGQCECSW